MSWNGRGIFLSDPIKGKLKGSHLAKLACKAHVPCLQEVRGLRGGFEHSFGLLLPGLKVLYSPSVNRDGTFDLHSGVVAALLCPSLCAVANFEEQIVVPGRCLAAPLKVRDEILIVCNVHNYGSSVADIKALRISFPCSALVLNLIPV